jgi:hypothetical protein
MGRVENGMWEFGYGRTTVTVNKSGEELYSYKRIIFLQDNLSIAPAGIRLTEWRQPSECTLPELA